MVLHVILDPMKKIYSIRANPDVWLKLKVYAAENGLSIEKAIARLLLLASKAENKKVLG